MATYYARKNGNINATDVWATTPSGTASDVFSSLTSSDVLVANSFTVTVNVNTTVGTVTNDTRDGATSGGSFTLNNGVVLTASLVAGAATLCNITGTASATIVGNITGPTGGSSQRGVSMGSSGTLTVTGNITGGGATGAIAVFHNSAGTVTITGNVTGGTTLAADGVYNNSTGTVTITGNVTGGSGTPGVTNLTTGTVTIVGTVTGAASVGCGNSAGGTVTITGRAKGGPLTNSAVGASNSTTGSLTVDELEFGDTGIPPTSGPTIVANKTSNVCLVYRTGGLGKKTLVDINSTTLLPAASDVRFGTTYNSGATTGTCRVPSAANVLQGVLVDATSGTLMLTAADFWAYATSSATTAGSMGERLKNCATVTSTGQQIADAVGA